MIGRRVLHERMGYGKIIDVRRGGREYQIDFEDPPIRTVLSSSEVSIVDSQGLDFSNSFIDVSDGLESVLVGMDIAGPTSRPEFEVDPAFLSSRKMIEAFRLGVVPYDEIEEFTFSRENELKQVMKALKDIDRDGGSIRVIQGEYGSGKSHFLEYVKHIALNEGWVVASTEFDQTEIKPQIPKTVYKSLLVSLHAKKGGYKNIGKLLLEASNNPEIYEYFNHNNHPFISRLFEILRFSKTYNREILWQWFLGYTINIPVVRKYCEENRLPSFLANYSTAPIVCNILGSIAFISRLMGYKGLVLFFDESESISYLSSNYLKKAENFILGLKLASLGQKKSGIENDELCHPKRGVDLNYVFHEPSYLAIIFAMTPRPLEQSTVIDEMVEDEWVVPLPKFSRKDFIQMAKRLIEIYYTAYNVKKPITDKQMIAMIDYIFEKKESRFPTIRLMIKSIIEVLDIMRFYPQENLIDILQDRDEFFDFFED